MLPRERRGEHAALKVEGRYPTDSLLCYPGFSSESNNGTNTFGRSSGLEFRKCLPVSNTVAEISGDKYRLPYSCGDSAGFAPDFPFNDRTLCAPSTKCNAKMQTKPQTLKIFYAHHVHKIKDSWVKDCLTLNPKAVEGDGR